MFSIAVEGLDGSGKTTIAKFIADELNFQYKNDYLDDMLCIDEEHFFRIKEKIKDYADVRTLLFMSSLIYATKSTNEGVVYDRFILSEYYYDGNEDTMSWFLNFCKHQKLADLTIILYASDKIRKDRICKRDINDPDLKKTNYGEDMYKKMIYFANYINLNYIVINTDNMSIYEVKREVIKYIYGAINKNERTKKLFKYKSV